MTVPESRSGDELKKFVVFQSVGLVTFLLSIPLMWGLDVLGLAYPVYTTINYVLSLVVGFFLNFKFAFGDQGARKGPAVVRYVSGYLVLLGVVQGLQYLAIDVAGWDRWVGVGAGMAVYAVAGYLLSRYWIFAAPRR